MFIGRIKSRDRIAAFFVKRQLWRPLPLSATDTLSVRLRADVGQRGDIGAIETIHVKKLARRKFKQSELFQIDGGRKDKAGRGV